MDASLSKISTIIMIPEIVVIAGIGSDSIPAIVNDQNDCHISQGTLQFSLILEHSTKMADSSANESPACGNGSEALVLTDVSFMEEVQKYDYLFNRKSKEFKDKYKNCLETIAKMFNSTQPATETKFKNI